MRVKMSIMWTLWTVACKMNQCQFSCQYLPADSYNFLVCSHIFQIWKKKSGNLVGQCCVNQSEQKESSISPREMAAAQVDVDSEKRRMEKQTSPDGQMTLGGAGSGQTDGGVASVEAEAPEKTAKMKPQPPGEQMEGSSSSETTTGARWEDQNNCLTRICLENVIAVFTHQGTAPVFSFNLMGIQFNNNVMRQNFFLFSLFIMHAWFFL